MAKQFRFPDVGEGITEGEIVRWAVQEGDEVHVRVIRIDPERRRIGLSLRQAAERNAFDEQLSRKLRELAEIVSQIREATDAINTAMR